MYLVLTAMLALNVSAEIINGFTKIRHSMDSSVESTFNRTSITLKQFQYEYEKDDAGRAKYGEWWEVAQAIHNKSDEFYNFIEQFKLDIANMVDNPSEPYTVMPDDIKGGSDTNNPHAYAFNQTGSTGKTHAQEFEDWMDNFREYLTHADSECIKRKVGTDKHFAQEWEMKIDMFNKIFSTDDIQGEDGIVSWQTSIFHEMPASAVFALLSKYQYDIRMAENDLINFMFNAAGASNFVVNQITAVVLPQSGEYVMQGQRFSAKIVSGAVDTLNLPQVFINGTECPGGIYEVTASGLGEHKYSGYILMPGDTTRYTFTGQYTVGAPSAAIANLDLDVMYSGYNNRFNISVPGVSADKIKVECANAKVSKSGNEWIINPAKGKETKVVVRAEQNGKVVEMGSQVFRLKPLPSPDAYISFGGQISASEKMQKSILVSGGAGVVADYGPEALIKAKFTVKSFSVKFPNGQEERCTGTKFSANAIKLIRTVKPGNVITIRNVLAVGENGEERTLRTLSIELQ